MRSKLQKFTEFAQALLPHETAYLLSIQQFDDKIKLGILERVDHNCRSREQALPYDEELDKRKYSNLKQWISERLHATDVDTAYEWLLEAERQIETDSIAPEVEERLLELLRVCSPTEYRLPGNFADAKKLPQNRAYRRKISITGTRRGLCRKKILFTRHTLVRCSCRV